MSNLDAFRMTVRACEGTDADDGYRALFGYRPGNDKLFDSFDDHPRVRTYETHDEFIRNGKLDYTTAAGAYQITETTFNRLSKKLGARDFGPPTQDLMAAELIAERGAMADVKEGRLQEAMDKCAPVWASLPASTVGQPVKTYVFATAAYAEAGGTFA